MKRIFYLPFFLFGSMIILLSGCWDSINIEDRNFVLGVAIDLADKQHSDEPNIELTTQFAVPAGIGGPEQDTEEDNPYTNITATGKTMSEIQQDMASKASRLPFFSHLRLLVFSEEIAKRPHLIGSLTDKFIREADMRRGINVVVAKDKAKDLLNIDQAQERLPTNFIRMLMENNNNTLETIDALRIGEMQRYLLDESSYVLPQLDVVDGRVHSGGGAVFHGQNNELIGELNTQEVKGFNLVKHDNEAGMIGIEIDGKPIEFEVDKTKSNIKVEADDPNHIRVSIHVHAEGYLAEIFGHQSVLKDEYIKKVGKKVSRKMKKLINGTIEKSQQELHTDFLRIRKEIKHKHYSTWKEIKDDWEEGKRYYDDVTFDVKTDAQVKDTGSTDRVK